MNNEVKMQETKEQEHLRGGQESPDMTEFRERMRKDGLMHDLIEAVNALSTQQFFTVQGLSEMCELQSATIKALDLLTEELRHSNGALAEDIHAVIHEDASVKVDTGLDDTLMDALYSNGEGLAESVDHISTVIECACDPATDDRVKVYVNGELATYPQPY